MLHILLAIWATGVTLYVALVLWHTTTVDAVKPRPLRRVWSRQDQAEFDERVNARQRGDA